MQVNLHQYGGVAHLGERLNGIQEVVGSIPIISTKVIKEVPIIGTSFIYIVNSFI